MNPSSLENLLAAVGQLDPNDVYSLRRLRAAINLYEDNLMEERLKELDNGRATAERQPADNGRRSLGIA